MKIRRKSIVIVFLLVIIAGIIGGIVWLISDINSTWSNEASWTTKEVLILPKEAKDLKVTFQQSAPDANGTRTFSFTSDYCYLYEMTPDEAMENVQFKCSLLPMYYIKRQMEVPKTWQQKSDILFTINKNDAEPTEFLGKTVKDFEMLSHQGYVSAPVSVSINGTYQYPKFSWGNKMKHYFQYKTKGAETITATITTYALHDLQAASAKDKSEYTKKWLGEIKANIAQITQNILKNDADRSALLTANRSFAQKRQKCFSLSQCRDEYEGNAADTFSYVYFLDDVFPEYTQRMKKALHSSMIPFNNQKIEDLPEYTEDNWNVFSVYQFPICPIRDIKKGKTTESYQFLNDYIKGGTSLEADTINKTSIQSKLLDFNTGKTTYTEEFINSDVWNAQLIDSINYACLYAIEGDVPDEFIENLKTAYYKVLSVSVGVTLDENKENYDNLIYASSAYSPYKSYFVTNDSVHKTRNENSLETDTQSAETYVEWRSRMYTFVLYYLIH